MEFRRARTSDLRQRTVQLRSNFSQKRLIDLLQLMGCK